MDISSEDFHRERRRQKRKGRWDCTTDCLERPLGNLFSRYGRFISAKPYPFLVIPVIMAVGLGMGFIRFRSESDSEYLFTPTNGAAKTHRQTVLDNFPEFKENGSFINSRNPYESGSLILLIEKEDGGNLLSEEGLDAVLRMDQLIQNNISISEDDKDYYFRDICATWEGDCVPNDILDIFKRNISYVGQVNLTYPIHSTIFLGNLIGGVEGTPMGEEIVLVDTIKVIKLSYFIKYRGDDNKRLANAWFGEARKILDDNKLPGFTLYWKMTDSLDDELSKSSLDIIPKFSITYTVMITFSVVSCMMLDCVRSKPWLALTGVLAAGLGIVSGFGSMMAIGLAFTSQVASMPFLAIGIGVDNMFVLISAWRRSNIDDDVGGRMATTLKDAGVSITITTLTDLLAFCIGASSTFRSVQIFCLYTGASVLFSYIYCMTLFVGAMVISGRIEKDNKCCACVTPKDEPEPERIDYRYDDPPYGYRQRDLPALPPRNMYKGGKLESPDSVGPPGGTSKPRSEHAGMKFFRDIWGTTLVAPWMKWQIVLLYLLYLGVSLYGCTQMKEGFDLKKIASDDSYLVDFYNKDDEHLKDFGPSIMVCVTEKLEYYKKETQDKIDSLLTKIEENEFFVEGMRRSWLDDYLSFLQLTNTPTKTELAFVTFMENAFLKVPAYEHYKVDLNINDKKEIVAARFMVQSKPLNDTNQERDMMLRAREIAEESMLDVTVFHQSFIFIDQYVVILKNTMTNLGIAFACMLVVALLLVPHPVTAMWVALSIVSIELGLVGIMTFWNVNLDSVSMINLILCIGFSVDFSAHVAYAFISSSAKTKDEKAVDTMYIMGYPIFQGGVSTILGVVVLSTSKSYIFRTFFKTMFLVMILGMFHSLVFLPIALSLFSPNVDIHHKNKDHKDINKKDTNRVQPMEAIPRIRYINRSRSPSSDPDGHRMATGAVNSAYLFDSANQYYPEDLRRQHLPHYNVYPHAYPGPTGYNPHRR